ncbi:MAG: glycogen/starch/alpha-glucan phosphorylase [Spirochaetaceae bacterium]|nr:glycogen/starch/alpha-glucan phosphorylase [Spirochaetaceae bacterium]MCF7947932.1 glycogen/starch/alpha-glucan phosphorylase [Spirochaetia bacterium]MCF7950678.1 glycogen/starch/alpha-glucan phosphorylase [Spirochaetaceae bacterium]
MSDKKPTNKASKSNSDAIKNTPAPHEETHGLYNSRHGKDGPSVSWGFAEHLKYTLGADRFNATSRDQFMALAYTIRDRIMHQWLKTKQTHYDQDVKRVYYLSMEFLMGRAMGNNIINMELKGEVHEALEELGYRYEELAEQEVDAGLGNGGLGRLAACFLDSMATMDLPAYGYGLRYDYGIFRQKIDNGYQVEQPDDWLRWENPWEIERPEHSVDVYFGGRVEPMLERGSRVYRWVDAQSVKGIPYDMPIVGYGGATVNTLRLWSARAAEEFDFEDFNAGDYVEAVSAKVMAENLTKVLYPNDKLYLGKELRLKQQYFFVSCSLQDILRRFKRGSNSWDAFPKYAAIQLNDTHPSLAVPELMRLLIDEEGLRWNHAWNITGRTLGYTNHTLMPEALEKWPVPMLDHLLPRHLQIIYEINHRFLQKAITVFPQDMEKIRRVSLVEETTPKQIRMAHLSIVGSHSTNGVAELHTKLLKRRLVPELAAIFPERFNSKTNGITQRRFLLHANPPLAELINSTIGNEWITDLSKISKLKQHIDDPGLQEALGKVKRQAKVKLSDYIHKTHGWVIDPDSFFDVQVKRMHEYKRQLLNAIHIVILYNRMRKGNPDDFAPRTYLFAGKAAPGYEMAKLIIKFINNIAAVINYDAKLKGRLKVHFLPNYSVSLAERIIPATDLSEQISTAGTEASGTGNMKFMCNGALTIGTMDGANIEIVEEAGRENAFIFGMSADEVAELAPNYNPLTIYAENSELKEAVDLIFSGHFNFSEPGIFEPLRQALFEQGDQYMHLADLPSYCQAQDAAIGLYNDHRNEWNRKALINIASSGKFSSDRTIAQYAQEIWDLKACHVDKDIDPCDTLENARKVEE